MRVPCPKPCRRASSVAVAALLAAGCGWLPGAAAQEPLPQPEGAVAPPMYIGEPFPSGAVQAGVPHAVAIDMLPTWPRWFAGASGLIMTRTLESGAATMQPLGGVQLSTGDAGASWPGGVDLHLGRWFGARQHHAVEFIYWGVYGIGATATVASAPAASIQAIPQAAAGVLVGDLPASTFLANASAQSITRSDLVNDVEVNWIYALWDRPEFLPRDRAVSLMWLAGFRFFQVEDVLTLATTAGTTSLGAADLAVATNNNLYGGQVGAKFDWRFMPSVRLAVVPKFLVAGNAITNTTTLSSAAGSGATFADGSPVNVHATLGVFSWLGSIDTGLAWDVTDHWTLSLGYRVVGVGNIAQADGQWPAFIATPASLSGVSAGSSTIIHGGFAGFEGRY
ncbi:MAG: BBP7 family outer membrane beta-barrel protein [Planctomycetaceae bacterium]